MKWTRVLKIVSLLALAAALIGFAPAATQAAPLAQENLLQNPGMELPYSDNDRQPNGWGRWFEQIDKPADASALQYALSPIFGSETNPSGKYPELVHGGAASAHIGRQYDPWHAGLSQQVTVQAGSQVRFCAYGRLYANNDNYGKAPSVPALNGHMQVGIFPNGDASWNSANVIWSPQYNPHDTWQQICVDATVGDQGKVVVFTSADYRGSGAVHLDSWWDDASLVVLNAQPAPTATTASQPPAPQATAAPVQQGIVTSTPNPDGSIVHVVQSGDTLFALALAYDVPIDRIYSLNNLDASSILSIGQEIIIKASGSSAPAVTPTPEATTAAAETPASTAPAETPATPAATATVVVEQPTTAKLCVEAFDDANADGLLSPGEQPIAGVQFAVADSQGVQVASYTTESAGQPHCFTDLPAGIYNVAVQPASGTVATSDKRWSVALTSGATGNVEFGSRSDANAASNSNTSTGDSGQKGSGLSSLLGAGIGLVVLLIAGVLGAFVIARRRG